ncbi:hypothetical protein FRC03_008699 [Tulasnella sp. 419]|nr:hypothetical protein FRC03_008699 [Tulasnella sp. 419]
MANNIPKEGTVRDEEVQVDQRALIDKVLARYSGEFTIFRELLQNSDDASARIVNIHFHTQEYQDAVDSRSQSLDSPLSSSLPDLKEKSLVHWVFRHTGSPFRDADWDRLKKIAEGNPDEDKIGAFGVGFYSLFSVTDEPFVKSGTQWMGFHWKQNQLFARRGTRKAVNGGSDLWTTFDIPLREPSSFPGIPFDLAKFLATSLTFVANLLKVSIFLDGHQLVRLEKAANRPSNMTILEHLIPLSRQGTMKVTGVNTKEINMTALVHRWIYQASGMGSIALLDGANLSDKTSSSSVPPSEGPVPNTPNDLVRFPFSLTVYSAQIAVRLNREMLSELERATKKKPPSSCVYSLIYPEKDSYDKGRVQESVFKGLAADLDARGTARVFIGHATSQSTGIGGHISSRFIPTVERESLDLVHNYVALWNKELLCVGGFLARLVYDTQMSVIGESWNQVMERMPAPSEDINSEVIELEDAANRVLRFFSFYKTTPSDVFGCEMVSAFFSCSPSNPLAVLSTTGLRPAHDVRNSEPNIQKFVKKLPMLSTNVAKEASSTIGALQGRDSKMLKNVSLEEIFSELSDRVLSEEEMVHCMKWRIKLDKDNAVAGFGHPDHIKFLEVTRFLLSKPTNLPHEDGTIIRLESMKTIISPKSIIPPGFPLPPSTLPLSVSTNFQPDTLLSVFGWSELQVDEWVEYLATPSSSNSDPDKDMTTSATFAEQVFDVIANGWSIIPARQRARLGIILKDRTVVPTTSGMKIPRESYFSNDNVFPDLPVVVTYQGTALATDRKTLLEYLGVKRHVELQVVIDRMIHTGNWDLKDLIKYLVRNKSSLPYGELVNLASIPVFPQERPIGASEAQPQERTILSILYEPNDLFRRFGLPILDWGVHKWKEYSDEANLLIELGLKRYPGLSTIMNLMADPDDESIRDGALRYFLDHYESLYMFTYKPDDFKHLAYVPAVTHDGTRFMSTPDTVFVDPQCAIMGFAVVPQELRQDAFFRLRIRQHPSVKSVMNILLEHPPSDPDIARKYFEYMANRSDFSQTEYDALRQAYIIPAKPPLVDSNETGDLMMAMPGECIFKIGRRTPSSEIYSKLFIIVDFGPKANIFLKFCGVRERPTIQDLISILVQKPQRVYNVVGNDARYLEQLRYVALQGTFPPPLLEQMRTAPFLLGYCRTIRMSSILINNSEAVEQEADTSTATSALLKAEQEIIVDDTNAYLLFSDVLYTAPEVDILENFYHTLGSQKLSSLIKEECQASEIEDTKSPNAEKLRALVLERMPLFLYERQTSPKLELDWLSQADNFIVRYCKTLVLNRILTFQTESISRVQAVTAATMVSETSETRQILLLLSRNDDLDMYEVANSMCKIMLEDPRPNDILLFTTILSTDLGSLRRRGYNVDRILQQTQPALAQSKFSALQPQVLESSPAAAATSSQKNTEPESKSSSTPAKNYESKPRNPDGDEIPLRKTDTSITMVLDACFPERESVGQNRQRVFSLRQNFADSYCDTSVKRNYLRLEKLVSGYSLVVPSDAAPELQNTTLQKQEVIQRFAVAIIDPLKAVFNLSSGAVHIFHDPNSDLAAFNRDGSLYFSLKFYEREHDQDIIEGRTEGALVLWYYMFAHQIAHGTVPIHSAEHEFYFSSISKKHFIDFSRLMKTR